MSPIIRTALSASRIASTLILRRSPLSKSFSSGAILAAPPSTRIVEFDYKRCEPRPTVDYIRSEEEANEILACLRGNRVTISMEDVVSYRGKRSRREEPITMTIADGSGVIVLHLAPILKTGKFPVELKKLLENQNVIKQGFDVIHYCRQLLLHGERSAHVFPENLLRLKQLVTILEEGVYETQQHPDDFHALVVEKVFKRSLGAAHLFAYEFGGNLKGTMALEFLVNKAWSTHLIARRAEEMIVVATQELAKEVGEKQAEKLMGSEFDKCCIGWMDVEKGSNDR